MSYCIQVSRQRKPRAYSKVWKNWKNPAQDVRWQTGTSTPPAMPRSGSSTKPSRIAASAPGSMVVSASSVTTISPRAILQPRFSESALPYSACAKRAGRASGRASLFGARSPRLEGQGKLGGEPVDHAIGRAVVEDDDFVRRFRLGGQGAETFRQDELFVARANEHGQGGPWAVDGRGNRNRGGFSLPVLPHHRDPARDHHETEQERVVGDVDQADGPGRDALERERGVEGEKEQAEDGAEEEGPAEGLHGSGRLAPFTESSNAPSNLAYLSS